MCAPYNLLKHDKEATDKIKLFSRDKKKIILKGKISFATRDISSEWKVFKPNKNKNQTYKKNNERICGTNKLFR